MNDPHITIHRPLSRNSEEESIEAVVREMRIEMMRLGMRWAEFEHDKESGILTARGWPDKPSGASYNE